MDRVRVEDCFVSILESELQTALGCTEPIAIAYAASRARRLLEAMPDKLFVKASGNIVKNVKGVVVPNSGALKGIEAAAALGAISGRDDLVLEVLSSITEKDREEAKELLSKDFVRVSLAAADVPPLYIEVEAVKRGKRSKVVISGEHTFISYEAIDDKVLIDRKPTCLVSEETMPDDPRAELSIEKIVSFAESVDIERVKPCLSRQIECNEKIAREGLSKKYGASVGRTLLLHYDASDVRIRARAKAAAGSDARMSGCPLPVVINSGSGNQGITVSIPVIEYAKAWGKSEEELYRALALSNLVAIHQKRYIGALSAFCGAVNAATGAAAGICYLSGGRVDEISQTISAVLANVGGIVCDGAKPSCAAKIASALDAAILSYEMTMEGLGFKGGEGLVKDDVEKTIQCFGRVGREGMRETDQEILRLMLED